MLSTKVKKRKLKRKVAGKFGRVLDVCSKSVWKRKVGCYTIKPIYLMWSKFKCTGTVLTFKFVNFLRGSQTLLIGPSFDTIL